MRGFSPIVSKLSSAVAPSWISFLESPTPVRATWPRSPEAFRSDLVAVRAAVTEPWSNGQTEGQVNKLKLVKRQMYGRAKIDLLEARLLGAA